MSDDGPKLVRRKRSPRRDRRGGGRREGRGPGPRSRASEARIAASRALVEVEDGGHVEEVLPPLLPRDPADRGQAWFLALGVLRRQAWVDEALRPHLRQPLADLDAPVRAVLRMGAFELLEARTPRHAAVDQAVEAARALGAGRASGLVNAVLRRVEPPKDPPRPVALSHPSWLVARWDERYGPEATSAWCAANNEPPPLFLVLRSEAARVAMEAAEVALTPATVQGQAVPGVWRAEGATGRVDQLPGFHEGAFWVQDAASAWMTDLVPDGADTVLDACAAPGGKTFRLLEAGRQVVATDANPHRLDSLGESLHRLELDAMVRRHDWTEGPMPGLPPQDAVLVDAPCTGLGTVRRHPEIRWRRGPFDPGQAAERQGAILASAATHVKPGGSLVYIVCSPEPEEGVQVVGAFLAAHPDFALDEERTSAPPQAGEDAFWGARMVRR